MNYGEECRGEGVSACLSPSRTMTRQYTDAENTGAPVVPMLTGRNTADAGEEDHDEQVLSHRTPRV